MADRKVVAGHAAPVSVSRDEAGYLVQIIALFEAWFAAVAEE